MNKKLLMENFKIPFLVDSYCWISIYLYLQSIAHYLRNINNYISFIFCDAQYDNKE